MRAKDLEPGMLVAVGDRPQVWGRPVARSALFQARVARVLPKDEVERKRGHPENVEVEWTDERLTTRERRVLQSARLAVQLEQRAASRTGQVFTQQDAERIEAETVAAYADNDHPRSHGQLGRYRGQRERVYSGRIVEPWTAVEEANADLERKRAAVQAEMQRQHQEALDALAPFLDALADHHRQWLTERHAILTDRVDLTVAELVEAFKAVRDKAIDDITHPAL